jgi:hypothetical protein
MPKLTSSDNRSIDDSCSPANLRCWRCCCHFRRRSKSPAADGSRSRGAEVIAKGGRKEGEFMSSCKICYYIVR